MVCSLCKHVVLKVTHCGPIAVQRLLEEKDITGKDEIMMKSYERLQDSGALGCSMGLFYKSNSL